MEIVLIIVAIAIVVIVVVAVAGLKPARRSELPPPEARRGLDWMPENGEPVHTITEKPRQSTPPEAEPIQVRCPKCRSDQIATHKRGFSMGKAAAGLAAGFVMIPGGVLWGLHGRSKLDVYCVACGHRWQAGGA